MARTLSPLGMQVSRFKNAPRSMIGEVTRSTSGNVILRIGHETLVDESWRQTEHVVLTPDEARDLIEQLREQIEAGP